MPVPIARDAFVAFVQTLAGQELTTRTRHYPFTVRVTTSGLEFVPGSTGKPRPESFATVDRVLAELAASGSLQPGHYPQLTVNASYLLAMIALYLERRSSAPGAGPAENAR